MHCSPSFTEINLEISLLYIIFFCCYVEHQKWSLGVHNTPKFGASDTQTLKIWFSFDCFDSPGV
jgi:hypothetical protein